MSANAPAAPEDGRTAAPSATAIEDSLKRGLASVPGLDATLGLQHLRGRGDSYLRLLRKFAETRAADVEAMRARIASQDYTGLSSLVHNVQGVAGFLGAIEIEALASGVCTAVRTGRDATEIDRLATALIDAQSELAAGALASIAPVPAANK